MSAQAIQGSPERAPVSRSEHVLWLLGGLLVLLAAAGGQTRSDGVVQLGGWEMPTTCHVKLATGLDCAGCGLTRSFVAIAHGDLAGALALNWLGLPLFGLLLGQIAWRVAVLAHAPVERRCSWLSDGAWLLFAGLVLLAVAVWLVRLVAGWVLG